MAFLNAEPVLFWGNIDPCSVIKSFQIVMKLPLQKTSFAWQANMAGMVIGVLQLCLKQKVGK
jgi:hypothetical protein